ncbi:putative f5 8 type c domain protein [Neofusicoccum parvum]|nr:putative f5 8 type c domain protein [Neofusicoccum parvum]
MAPIFTLVASSLLPLCAVAEISVTSQLFQLAGGNAANNVKLSWTTADGATSYDILRKAGSGSYDRVATAPGNTYDIYDLGGAATFQVQAMNGASKVDSSADVAVTPAAAAAGSLDTYDNTVASSFRVKSDLVLDGTYYRYNYVTDSNGFSHFSQQTSTDGYTFSGDTSVLTRAEVCASVSDGFCKLESIKWAQHPQTNEVVMWAHFENAKDYTLGQVAVAHGTPGKGLTFGGAFRPAGDDSRDLTFFADDDGAGYIVSAIKTNTDLGLYALNAAWTNVTSKVATLQAGERREAPAMVHQGGFYYLFTSTAAGWYPSQGKFISAASLAGPWSASRNVGNVANFGAQSGQVEKVGDTYIMAANRWAAQWAKPEASNRQIMLPIAFADGLASYAFYETLRYSDDSGAVVPVQNGRVLSVGKTATSSGAASGSDPAAAVDGTQSDPANLFTPSGVPFWLEIDLGQAHAVTQVDVTPKQVGGSETYLQYNITGSTDQKTYSELADESGNTAVGFRSSKIDGGAEARYIRVNVQKVINIQNGNEADWAVGLHEVLVYGN